MARHNDTGRWGEEIAVDLLTAAGYGITETNWRSGHYEIDIIACKDDRIVFVEVKTRSGDSDPVEAVDNKKMMRIIRAGIAYVELKKINHDIQFDIIAINGTPDNYTVEHIPDAFPPPLKTY